MTATVLQTLTLATLQTFEINPKHPLIEALLEKVEEIDGDETAQAELKETVAVLWCARCPRRVRGRC